MEPSKLLLDNLNLLDRVVRFVCFRRGMSPDETEEFRSELLVRLVQDDYAAIRNWKSASSFSTFLTGIVQRALVDYRNRLYGKWHPSAEARHLGEVAIELERMLYRDRRPHQEAFALLTARRPDVTVEELEQIAGRLRERPIRRMVNLDDLADQLVINSTAKSDDLVVSADRQALAKRVSDVIRKFIANLPQTDRLLLQFRFESNLSIAQIARIMGKEQKPLYRRTEQLLQELRRMLLSSDLGADDIKDLIGDDTALLDFGLKDETKRPSSGNRSEED